MKKIWLLIYVMLLAGLISLSSMNFDARSINNQNTFVLSETLEGEDTPYSKILAKWQTEGINDDVVFNASVSHLDFFDPTTYTDHEKGLVVVLDDLSNQASFEIDVVEAGLYQIDFEYKAMTDSVRNIEVQILINDEVQYQESKSIIVPTYYVNDKEMKLDRYSNDIMPVAKRSDVWSTFSLQDTQRLADDVLLFKLNKGINNITIDRKNGELLLSKVTIKNKEVPLTYDEYLKAHLGTVQNERFMLEAEQPLYRNSLSIRYGTDRDSLVTPFSVNKQRLNIVNGVNFQTGGQGLYYEVEVENEGYYYLTIKSKQAKQFHTSFRRVSINDKVPFEEANLVRFNYQKKWANIILANDNGEAFKFYLQKGINKIGIEVNVSPFRQIYENLHTVMTGVNDISLDIKKISGSTLDKDREWDILSYLPNVQNELKHYVKLLKDSHEVYSTINKTNKVNEIVSGIKQSYETLEKLANKPNDLPKNLNKLSTDSNSVTATMGLIIPMIIESPLTMDKLYVHGDVKLPRANSNFFESFWLGIRRFFLTFFTNEYKPTKNSDTLEVWVNRSRQYVNVMQEMADAQFTPETGIEVNISLMPDESKLIMAASAGSQPDLALGVAGWRPYDFALRNAVYDLKNFDNFKEVSKRFYPGAFLQLVYEDGVYGIPETQNFNLLFYREDIMNKLNIDIPDTWDDVLAILPELQRYGLNFFAPLSTTGAFKGFVQTMPFIKQHNGHIYAADAMSTTIDSEEVIKAMTLMSELYTIYSLPLEVGSFYNSFRYGDIPIGIGDFGMYIRLLHAAPEIAGLWKISVIPGIKGEDGVVNRSFDGASTSGMIFTNSNKKKEAWQFLDWWTKEDTQLMYSNNLITSMGPEYMWNTSNINAFKNSSWDELDKEVFLEQWKWVNDTEKTPAAYMLERELSNAWNKIVFNSMNVRTAIEDAVVIIDKEIIRKMKEFEYIDQHGKIIKPYKIPSKETIEEILWK